MSRDITGDRFSAAILQAQGTKTWITDLLELYPSDKEVVAWLTTEHPGLGRSPLQAIRDDDEYKVERIVDQLASGAYI